MANISDFTFQPKSWHGLKGWTGPRGGWGLQRVLGQGSWAGLLSRAQGKRVEVRLSRATGREAPCGAGLLLVFNVIPGLATQRPATWETVRNAESRGLPQIYWITSCFWIKISRWFYAHSRSTGLYPEGREPSSPFPDALGLMAILACYTSRMRHGLERSLTSGRSVGSWKHRGPQHLLQGRRESSSHLKWIKVKKISKNDKKKKPHHSLWDNKGAFTGACWVTT